MTAVIAIAMANRTAKALRCMVDAPMKPASVSNEDLLELAEMWDEVAKLIEALANARAPSEFEAAVLHIQEQHLHGGVIDFEISPHATILDWFRQQQKEKKA